jgi:hypothetical protein
MGGDGPTFVTPGHDPTLDLWVEGVCPPDLRRYYCRHGHYVGFGNVFPCNLCGAPETTFVVDVEFSTHDDLQEGRTSIGTRRVEVLARHDAEAMALACQLVASAHDVMPTKATPV